MILSQTSFPMSSVRHIWQYNNQSAFRADNKPTLHVINQPKTGVPSKQKPPVFVTLGAVKLILGGLVSGAGGALLFGTPLGYSIALESFLGAAETMAVGGVFAFNNRTQNPSSKISSRNIEIISALVSGSNVFLASGLSLIKSRERKPVPKHAGGLLKNWKIMQRLRKNAPILLGLGVIFGLAMGYFEGYLANKIVNYPSRVKGREV